MPSGKARNTVFDAIPDRMGERADGFGRGRPNIEEILSIYFSAFGYSKLPRKYHAQRLGVNAGGEGKGQCRTLFDVDSLEKLVTLAPLLAPELFPSLPARLGAFGGIQQEHLHSHARLWQ
jgi:hypothetical protein